MASASDRSSGKKSVRRRWESALFAGAFGTVGIFLVSGFVGSAWKNVSSAYGPSYASVPVLNVTVKPGDTLWKYAARYGAPDGYRLDQIETIARDNRLDSQLPLTPGQHLKIAVHNPVLVAQLQAKSRLASR